MNIDRAMILSAGRGERLRPLTDHLPKPLVKAGGQPLLYWHVQKLRQAGILDIIVNSAWLHEQIEEYLGDGSAFGVRITHSVEGPGGLETAGGIIKALPFFEGRPFLAVNGDTLMDLDYRQFLENIPAPGQARIFLTQNPPHNAKGDFSLEGGRVRARDQGENAYTFTGAAVYTPEIFKDLKVQRLKLRPVLDGLIKKGALFGQLIRGRWFDVGTSERLKEADRYMQQTHTQKTGEQCNS